MKREVTKLLRRLFTPDEKNACCGDIEETQQNDRFFFFKIPNGDDSEFYGYDPETKHQLDLLFFFYEEAPAHSALIITSF